MARGTTSRWTDIKPVVSALSHADLVELVRDLFGASADNKAFLAARFAASDTGFEEYRRRIVEQFFPPRGFAKLRMGDVRKAIRDYRSASGDDVGTLDLLLTALEAGTRFTREYGDLEEGYYESLLSILTELEKLVTTPHVRQAYSRLRPRFQELYLLARPLGWYGDVLTTGLERIDREMLGIRDEGGGMSRM